MEAQTANTEPLADIRTLASPACLAVAHSSGVWIPAPHLLYIDRIVCDLIARRIPERVLIVEAPPRHGKSMLISRYTPAWFLAGYHDRKVILTSYADRLARGFGREARDVCRDLGLAFKRDANSVDDWQLDGFDGGMVTAGVGGGITGRGAHLLIIDDFMKNAEEALSETVRDNQWSWFQSTAWTRLEPHGVMIIMATRWHEDDLIGRLIGKHGADMQIGVKRIRLPAFAEEGDPLGREVGDPLWPERWSKDWLEQQQAFLDSYWFSALYQQKPGQYSEAEWPDEYFHSPFWSEDSDWPDAFELSCVAVDPAKGTAGGDFGAIVFAGLSRGLIWVDAVVDRIPVPKIAETTIAVHQLYNTDRVAIEGNGFQYLLGPEIDRVCTARRMAPLPYVMLDNRNNKTQFRIPRLGWLLHDHCFRFRRGVGVQRLVQQLRSFPFGDHDDGPDALEMAVRTLEHLCTQEPTIGTLRGYVMRDGAPVNYG